MADVHMGVASVPLRWLHQAVTWPVRVLVGTRPLTQRVERVEHHVAAMTDLVVMLLAQASASWTSEQRERVLRAVARFTIVGDAFERTRPTGNPVTAADLDLVRQYTDRAARGESFSEEEARAFRALAERIADEYSGEAWTAELLKIAWLVYGMDVVGKAMRP